MPAAYPIHLRSILRANKSRSQPAAFSMSEPRRGFAYAMPTGTDTPVFWDVAFRFTTAEALVFQLWFRNTLQRGVLPFTMPIRTEFGLLEHECRFLPDSLLPASEAGDTFGYTATIMARAQIVPAAYDEASELIVGLPGWASWASMLDETVTREWAPVEGVSEVASLFDGASGAWLDVADLASVFTNTTGTTAPTAYGQAVARVNDRSGAGANALQATSGSRPALRRGPSGGLRNTCTYTQQFDNAAWSKVAATVSADAAVAPDGSTTADTITEDTATTGHYIAQSVPFVAGLTYTLSGYFKAATLTRYLNLVLPSGAFGTTKGVVVNLSTGVVESNVGAVAVAVTNAGSGWWRVAVTAVATISTSTFIQLRMTSTTSFASSYTGTTGSIYAWGAQCEAAAAAGMYQQVLQAHNGTEPGKADVFSLFFDGVDDAMTLTFAAALGSDCTVVRADPNLGVVITGGMTIGTSYSVTQNLAALVVLDRALTAVEAAALTAHFTAQIGV